MKMILPGDFHITAASTVMTSCTPSRLRTSFSILISTFCSVLFLSNFPLSSVEWFCGEKLIGREEKVMGSEASEVMSCEECSVGLRV